MTQQFTKSLNALMNTGYPVNSIVKVLTAAMEAAEPYGCVARNLDLSTSSLQIGDRTYLLTPESRIVIVGIGKASLAMCAAAAHKIADRLEGGVCVCKHLPETGSCLERVEIVQGSHPVPDERSVNAGRRIKEVVSGLNENDIVLLLVSGGGSALVCLPADGICLEDMQQIVTGLLKSGASINELNAVRKHLDLIKGGGLLKMAQPARMGVLVISDVVNNPLDVIASGPAVPDPSTFTEAYDILIKYLDRGQIPTAVLSHLECGRAGEISETLKATDEASKKANHTLIASNQASANSALQAALVEGFTAEIMTTELTGEARLAGEHLADRLRQTKNAEKPWLGIAGGETTVKVKGKGLGGRNLEVALAAVEKMSGLQNELLVTLATDGEDGPTDAAGAFVTGETYERGKSMGLDPNLFLAENDAYHYFAQVGGLILTGPSGTNVNDLNFLFRF